MLLTEFNEYILGLVSGNFIKVLSYKNLDWLGIPILWDFLSEEMRLEIKNKS